MNDPMVPPAALADRIELYLDEPPTDGGHSDAAGANVWELLREAVEALRTPALPSGQAEALERIWDIVHTPTKATIHRSAERHFMADFDAIRKIIKDVGALATSPTPQIVVREYLERYEFRDGENGYIPNDHEKTLIEDAIEGYLVELAKN